MADATGVKMETIKLTPRAVLKLWHVIEPQVAKALEHGQGESDTFDVFNWLMNPEYGQCWVVFSEDKKPLNITITRINAYGQHRSLCIVLTASIEKGKVNTFNDKDKSQVPYKIMHDKLYDFAKENVDFLTDACDWPVLFCLREVKYVRYEWQVQYLNARLSDSQLTHELLLLLHLSHLACNSVVCLDAERHVKKVVFALDVLLWLKVVDHLD